MVVVTTFLSSTSAASDDVGLGRGPSLAASLTAAECMEVNMFFYLYESLCMWKNGRMQSSNSGSSMKQDAGDGGKMLSLQRRGSLFPFITCVQFRPSGQV